MSGSGKLLTLQRWLSEAELSVIPSQQCENVYDQHDYTRFVFLFLSNVSAQQICC